MQAERLMTAHRGTAAFRHLLGVGFPLCSRRANARRRFSAVSASRTRAVGQHGENLCGVARQVHHVGRETKSDGLETGGIEASHVVSSARARAEFDAGRAPVLTPSWRWS